MLEEDNENDVEYDCETNGGKITNRDAWNIVNQEPLKLVVVHLDTDAGFLTDRRTYGRYICRVTRGAKYSCKRRDQKTWYADVGLDIGTDPCDSCKLQYSPECDRSTLKKIEDDILLLQEDDYRSDD